MALRPSPRRTHRLSFGLEKNRPNPMQTYQHGPVELRFYGELNDFLPLEQRQRPISYDLAAGATAKHAIEALGVPHTEVALILIDGEPARLSARLQPGQRISVYPAFRAIDLSSPGLATDPIPPEPRFVLDTHLGKLATYLRLLGFDTLYWTDCDDQTLARVASAEQRILLTRDRALLMRRLVERGFYVRDDDPDDQLLDVVRRFDLAAKIAPFRRCAHCNSLLEKISKADVLDRLQPRTRLYYDEFSICRTCDQVYWRGSHWEHLQSMIERLQRDSRRQFTPSSGDPDVTAICRTTAYGDGDVGGGAEES